MSAIADQLTLLACQLAIPSMTSARERDQHLEASAQKVSEQLSQQNADVVVLPELSSIDYSRAAFDVLDELAEPLDGASFQAWRGVAQKHQCFVSYSFARRGDVGNHISIAVVNPQGDLVGHYDKLHLAQYGASMEKEYFVRGAHVLVYDVKGFRLSPFICYDIRIPELARTLVVDHGADVLLHCGAYYRDESFHTWHHFAITRALENQVFFLSLNRAGETYGNSVFCWPWMDENTAPLHFAATAEEFKFVKIEKRQLAQAREAYTFLGDRLDDYHVLPRDNTSMSHCVE